MAYNGFSKAVTAALLFKASSSFDAAASKPGCNVSNLLSAIGAQGLTKLWHQLTVFAWTVSLSQVGLKESPFHKEKRHYISYEEETTIQISHLSGKSF